MYSPLSLKEKRTIRIQFQKHNFDFILCPASVSVFRDNLEILSSLQSFDAGPDHSVWEDFTLNRNDARDVWNLATISIQKW